MSSRFGITASREAVAKSHASRTPGLARVSQTYRRRVDDAVEDAFKHACLVGDVELASDLVEVLERAVQRRTQSANQERRSANQHLIRMQAELALRQEGRVVSAVS